MLKWNRIQKWKAGNEKARPCTGNKLWLIRITAGLICLLAATGLFYFVRGREISVEQEQYAYQLLADCGYKVYLRENTLFESNPLEEGGSYASRLTDYIEASFLAKLLLSRDFPVQLQYTLKSVLVGMESGGSEKQIYKKEYLLAEQSYTETGRDFVIEEKVNIKAEEYEATAAAAEEELGARVDTLLFLEFSGSMKIMEEDGKIREEEFSRILPLTLPSRSALYTIEKPEALQKAESVKSSVMVQTGAEGKIVLPLLVLFILALGALGASFYGLREAKDGEISDLQVKKMLRKYGSRMVGIYGEPDIDTGRSLYVTSIDALMLLADELQKPVHYRVTEEGEQPDHRFYLYAGNFIYVYVQKGYTPKEV